MKKFLLFVASTSGVALLTLLCLLLTSGSSQSSTSLIEAEELTGLPQKDTSGIDTSHLAPGLTPPTNKWFSGLALQKIPKTVFPTPLSFTATETSFSVDLPVPTTTKDTIFSTPTQPLTISVANATHYQVTRYDELSVDLTYSNERSNLGTVTLVAGSPYVYFHATNSNAKLTIHSTATLEASSKTTATAKGEGTSVIAAFDGATLSQKSDSITATLPKNGLVTFYGLPGTGSNDSLRQTADNRITGTEVRYKQNGKNYDTTITLSTNNNQPTSYGLLPHQANTSNAPMQYDTLYGKQRIITGKEVVFSTPAVPVSDSLNLTKLSRSDKTFLTDTLRREINATQLGDVTDTYFGGKALYRSAQLLDLAKQLGEENIASTIQQKLRTELSAWFSTTNSRSNKLFYYDTKIHGIVGETASFGSQEFNDHHFHYGYFIYAASVLAKYDPDFLTQYGAAVNLLVADIANYNTDEKLPARRLFDPYFGHSWASGSSPFSDGNNQESSSEAINAWTATSLWAKQTHNSELQTESDWMLSSETEAMKKYWLNISPSDTPYSAGYAHSLVSLNWGGKRDYATFFSANKNAMLGILLIPLNPTLLSQLGANDKIASHVDEAISNSNYNVQFGDYILMYRSLQKDGEYLSIAKSLPDSIIDGANSRSYMYAWIMSRKP